MLIDLHADTPLWQRWLGYDFCRSHRPWLPAGAWLSNLDLPRMHEANMDAQVFGLVALPFEGDGWPTVQRMIDGLEAASTKSRGVFALVRTAGALIRARDAGARVGMLSLEGVHSLRGDLSRADALIDRGVVSFGLAHFHANEACRPEMGLGADASVGLSEFGRALVAHLHKRGVIVDLTHINRKGFTDALEASSGPVMVTHTGLSGVYPIRRNLDDGQIKAVASRGGIIGVIFSRHFLGGNDVDAVVRHLKYLVNIGGTECAALGSDFDGFVVPVRGLRDVTGLPALAEALRRSGLAPSVVEQIMGGNALRFLRQALG